MISQQAVQIGFNEIFHLLGILFLVVIVFVWFAKPPFAAKIGGGGGGWRALTTASKPGRRARGAPLPSS